MLISIKRGELDIIPSGNTRIKAGDYFYVLVEEGGIIKYEKLLKLSGGEV